jgi:hypothetical protein
MITLNELFICLTNKFRGGVGWVGLGWVGLGWVGLYCDDPFHVCCPNI